MIKDDDHDRLAVAVDVTLELLDVAERRMSGPGVGHGDGWSEREWIKSERRRYKELRARLIADERHGVHVVREFLELALSLGSPGDDDIAGDACYEEWFREQVALRDSDQ